VNKLLRDCVGSSLVEFTLIFPVFILVAFGTVDIAYMLSDWALANKAAYAGAHRAIVTNPVAVGITNLAYDPSKLGQLCFDPSTGLASGNCPLVQDSNLNPPGPVVCTPAATAGGRCTGGYSFDDRSFDCHCTSPGVPVPIFNQMHQIFPRLQRQNVTISYQTNNLGFNGRPDGLPMNVTVTITGMTHQFYFLGPVMRLFGGNFAATPPIPNFTTTLTSEDMVTN
jgi:TadE-like protein